MRYGIILLACACALLVQTMTAQGNNETTFFGTATIDREGTICLRLRTQEPGQPVAEGYFCYKKTDPDYRKIRDHVGPIEVGEEKQIRPFDKE